MNRESLLLTEKRSLQTFGLRSCLELFQDAKICSQTQQATAGGWRLHIAVGQRGEHLLQQWKKQE